MILVHPHNYLLFTVTEVYSHSMFQCQNIYKLLGQTKTNQNMHSTFQIINILNRKYKENIKFGYQRQADECLKKFHIYNSSKKDNQLNEVPDCTNPTNKRLTQPPHQHSLAIATTGAISLLNLCKYFFHNYHLP